MNTGLIFAGGIGTRMNATAKPKQFLELHGKPIIVYTLEVFEAHPEIDKILVVCVEEYIPELWKLIRRYEMHKIVEIVKGGSSGFESIFNGLTALDSHCADDDIVLIHDGVRPFIDEELISENINCTKVNGNAITTVPVTEGIIISSDGKVADDYPNRRHVYSSKAPQTFKYKYIFDMYKRARNDGFEPIESAHLCQHYGEKLHMVKGSANNIKITTPTDYYIFKAIYEAIENSQFVGF